MIRTLFQLLKNRKAMSWQVLAVIILGLLVVILLIIWISGLGKTGDDALGGLPF